MTQVAAFIGALLVIGIGVYISLALTRTRKALEVEVMKRKNAELDGWTADELGRLRTMTGEELRMELERMLDNQGGEE